MRSKSASRPCRNRCRTRRPCLKHAVGRRRGTDSWRNCIAARDGDVTGRHCGCHQCCGCRLWPAVRCLPGCLNPGRVRCRPSEPCLRCIARHRGRLGCGQKGGFEFTLVRRDLGSTPKLRHRGAGSRHGLSSGWGKVARLDRHVSPGRFRPWGAGVRGVLAGTFQCRIADRRTRSCA